MDIEDIKTTDAAFSSSNDVNNNDNIEISIDRSIAEIQIDQVML